MGSWRLGSYAHTPRTLTVSSETETSCARHGGGSGEELRVSAEPLPVHTAEAGAGRRRGQDWGKSGEGNARTERVWLKPLA